MEIKGNCIMKREKKLALEDLKIKSFIPSSNQGMVKGGNSEGCGGLSISINLVECCEDNSTIC
jgi:hypothetical protein